MNIGVKNFLECDFTPAPGGIELTPSVHQMPEITNLVQ